jgi:methyl-accepting chemotaxis protein
VNAFTSVRRRVWAGMVVLIALVFTVAVLGVSAIRDLERSVNEEVELLLRTTTRGSALVTAVSSEIRAAQQYLDLHAPAAKAEFLRAGDSAYVFQRRYGALPSLTTSDRYAVNRIGAVQARLEVAYAYAHALSDLGRQAEAQKLASQVWPAADTLIAEVQSLTLAQTGRSLARAQDLKGEAARRRVTLWLLWLVALGIGIGASLLTVRAVDLPLRRLVRAADRFGAGDLRPPKLGAMPLELERLASAMAEMASRLRTVVRAVTNEAHQISGKASDFSAVSQELAASSGEISDAMSKMATSAEHQVVGMREADALLLTLRRAAESNAKAATQAVALGDTIRNLAAHHQADVRAAGETLLDIRAVVQTSAGQVQQLTKLSESVTDFIALIKQISSQTNLLALNAAIEAARAGEHGRGFAVVAEEVRRLADSSAAAAEEVATTVEFIRSQVREVSTTMELGSAKVSGVEGVAAAAARGLEEITVAVRQVTGAAAEVAREAEETRRIVDQLSRTTTAASATAGEHASMSEEVTAAAEQQSASTEQMATAAGELLQGAHRLTTLMADFKT